jgi:RNA polymerase sigma factor (sigma-70 family)
MDERELLRAAASNAGAFAELVRLHVTRVYRYHMAHLGIAKEAEALTSQTFRAALENLSSFHRSGSFAAWLMEIAAKKRLNDSRGNRRELPMDAVLYYQNATLPTDRVARQRMEMEATSRALKQISPDPAEALILTFFCDLSNSEVSLILKKSTATIRTLIARGLQEVRTSSTLALEEERAEDEGLTQKLINIASQITPDPHFLSELEDILVASHLPKTTTFSLQQIASLAGWAFLIAAGVFLLYWRVIPNSASMKPFIANTGNANPTAATEAAFTAFSEGTSTPAPTVRATATRLATLEYIVQEGDTCTYIADRFGVTINQLIALNRLNVTCDIWIDQKLVIPITPTPTPQTN